MRVLPKVCARAQLSTFSRCFAVLLSSITYIRQVGSGTVSKCRQRRYAMMTPTAAQIVTTYAPRCCWALGARHNWSEHNNNLSCTRQLAKELRGPGMSPKIVTVLRTCAKYSTTTHLSLSPGPFSASSLLCMRDTRRGAWSKQVVLLSSLSSTFTSEVFLSSYILTSLYFQSAFRPLQLGLVVQWQHTHHKRCQEAAVQPGVAGSRHRLYGLRCYAQAHV